MDEVVLYSRQHNTFHAIEEHVLDVNIAIHFLANKEYRDSQDSPQPESDTCAWIKQETLDKCCDYTKNFSSCVSRITQKSLDQCRVNSNSVPVDCTVYPKRSVEFDSGIHNLECNSDIKDMGIVKSRRNSHTPIDIVETELEYNPSHIFKRSLSPRSEEYAENTVKYSFNPVKSEILESCQDRVYSVNVTDVGDSSVGDLLMPIRSRASSVAGRSPGKNLQLSGGKSDAKRRGRPPGSGKITSVKGRGRPSQGKLTSKNTTRLSAGNTETPPEVTVAAGNGRSRKPLDRVPKTSERKPKVLSSPISKAKVQIRSKSKVSVGKLRCSACPFTTNSRTLLARHKPAHSQDLVCRWCGLQYPTLQALGRHTLLHQEAKTFVCSRCDFSCQYLWMLHSHRSSAHPEAVPSGARRSGRTYRCQACQYTCHKVTMLKRHMLIHLQLRPYSCKLCPFTCNIKYNLKLHMARHTREKPHACKICGMRFSRSHALTLHSRVHTGEKPHACDRCNFTCAHFSSLKRHRLQHEKKLNERMCCPTCNFACKLIVTYLKHRATEHGERGLYSCHLCHASLDNTRQLAKHLWKHKKEGRYGDNEELFRLPKYLVRIRDKKKLKPKQVKAQQIVAQNVLEATRRLLNDPSNTSIGKLIIKNVGRSAKAGKIVRKVPEELPTEHNMMPKDVTVPMDLATPLPELKVVCRRLTISEIIRRRVVHKF